MASPEECPWGLQTVQPFAYVKSGSFFNNQGIRWALRVQAARGAWGHATPENVFWNLMLWNAIPVFCQEGHLYFIRIYITIIQEMIWPEDTKG